MRARACIRRPRSPGCARACEHNARRKARSDAPLLAARRDDTPSGPRAARPSERGGSPSVAWTASPRLLDRPEDVGVAVALVRMVARAGPGAAPRAGATPPPRGRLERVVKAHCSPVRGVGARAKKGADRHAGGGAGRAPQARGAHCPRARGSQSAFVGRRRRLGGPERADPTARGSRVVAHDSPPQPRPLLTPPHHFFAFATRLFLLRFSDPLKM